MYGSSVGLKERPVEDRFDKIYRLQKNIAFLKHCISHSLFKNLGGVQESLQTQYKA